MQLQNVLTAALSWEIPLTLKRTKTKISKSNQSQVYFYLKQQKLTKVYLFFFYNNFDNRVAQLSLLDIVYSLCKNT